jgi:hypothetical protein
MSDYRVNDADMFGFVFVITSKTDGQIIGNALDVGDYSRYAKYLKNVALPLDNVTLHYTDDWGMNAGKTITVSRKEYDDDRHRLMSESGNRCGDNDIFTASGIAQKYNCALKRLDFQQEQGLMSSLDLGHNEIRINRGLTEEEFKAFANITFLTPFSKGKLAGMLANKLADILTVRNDVRSYRCTSKL